MAKYDNLPVYKATYDLLLELFVMNVNLKRDYRYTLGERLRNSVTELAVIIYRANISTEINKEIELRNALEKIVAIKIYIRMLHDLKQISLKRFAALSGKIEDIAIQLTAWHKSTKKRAPIPV